MYEKEIFKTYKYCFIIFVCLCVTPNRSLCCHATQGEAFRDIPNNGFSKWV